MSLTLTATATATWPSGLPALHGERENVRVHGQVHVAVAVHAHVYVGLNPEESLQNLALQGEILVPPWLRREP